MAELFIDLIRKGRISSVEELKAAFRRAALKTHPDTTGTEGEEEFITLRDQYEKALEYLSSCGVDSFSDPRQDFFACWEDLENLGFPYNHTTADRERRERLSFLMKRSFAEWQPDMGELYIRGMAEYDYIREEKPPNDLAHLRQTMLADQMKPLVYDLCRLALNRRKATDAHLLRTLKERVAPPLLERLVAENYNKLYELISFLLNSI